jgi:hypothetical protein
MFSERPVFGEPGYFGERMGPISPTVRAAAPA